MNYRVSRVLQPCNPRPWLQFPELVGDPGPDDEAVVSRDEESRLSPGGSVVGLTGVEMCNEDRHSQGQEGREW